MRTQPNRDLQGQNLGKNRLTSGLRCDSLAVAPASWGQLPPTWRRYDAQLITGHHPNVRSQSIAEGKNQ
jgi:hypothetical protein